MLGSESWAAAQLHAGNRLGVLGAQERRARLLPPSRSCGSREPLRPPRLLLPLSEESGAARSQSRSAARRPEPPPPPCPRVEALQGELRRLRGGAGVARALDSPLSRPRVRREGAQQLDGKLGGGGAAGRQRLLGTSQAGRVPGWEESCKPGLGEGKQGARQESVSQGGKGPRAEVRAPRVPLEQVATAGASRSFHRRAKSKTREVYGAGAEQCLPLVKPQHDLDKLAKANSGSLLLPQSWQRQSFKNFVTTERNVWLSSEF